MSWNNTGMNNVYGDFPPMMCDSRVFSYYQTEDTINENIKQSENITSNWNYRQYMTQNGNKIMKYNFMASQTETGINCNFDTMGKTHNSPQLYTSTFDTEKVEYSDLKAPYLSRQQLNARMISPSVKPYNLTNPSN